jgi:Family of unknown function (DUF6492)
MSHTAGTGSPSLCALTPTHRRDIEQFSLLRRSIRHFAPTLPHFAIVNTEDWHAFRDRFRGEPMLEIITTADVLPRSVEHRRRKSGPKWRTGAWWYGRSVKGWYAQQLAKVFALAECRYQAAVFLDSDVFVCRALEASWFYVDGNLKLFRQRALNAEAADFDVSTHEILGNPLNRVPIESLYDYIYSPSCFRKSTAKRLLEEFRIRGRPRWIRRFLAERRPSEYNLLGHSAMVLEGGTGYHLVECPPTDLHHSVRFPEDKAHFEVEIEHMLRQPKHFALIQSSLDIEFREIESAFDRLMAAHSCGTFS